MSGRPRLRIDPYTKGSGTNAVPRPTDLPRPSTAPSYVNKGGLHESLIRTVQLELRLYSPSIKVYKMQGRMTGPVPVFGDHDQIKGCISLDPRSCSVPGRITLSFEGAFLFSKFNSDDKFKNKKQKHVFFTSSQVFYTSESQSTIGSKSVSSIREAFANTVRPKRIEQKSGAASHMTTPPSFPFKFEIPRPVRHGQEMPPSFKVSSIITDGNHGQFYGEQAEVSYTIAVLWEAADDSDIALLETPILFHHDIGFRSLDCMSLDPRTWLELPLRTDRTNMPFQCAITLPSPASSPRSASIPYFVVFTTHPRSSTLSREIAADATIAVSLLRVITINISQPYYTVASSIASTPTSAILKRSLFPWSPLPNDDETPTSAITPTSLIRRMVKTAPPVLHKASSRDVIEKPVLNNGAAGNGQIVSETRTLQTDMSIGFPKRPRYRCGPNQHPSLDAHNLLPDGLYKGKMQLNMNMIPSIDWAGLNVKYYLDVSVLFGQDELRARVPVRIF